MANKIILLCVLVALAGCDGQSIYGCLALPSPPQVLVDVSDAFTGEQIISAQVRVSLPGETANKTYDAVFIANPGGNGGIYKALPESTATNSQVSVSVAAKSYNNYQSKAILLKNDPVCGADNITRFAVKLCPVNALCE